MKNVLNQFLMWLYKKSGSLMVCNHRKSAVSWTQ